ncbi:MAG: hypothetical protein JJ895_14990 [Balneolaceae bacterium]|nr:hypothetical protein [Balneolaceae bacterium]
MKTHEKTAITVHLCSFAVMFTYLIFIAGCSGSNNPFSSEHSESSSISIDDLNINVKYAESYDETRITFSRHWPQSISQGLAKNVDESGEIMLDYERISKIIAFDDDGNLFTSTEYLEGDSQMNMPESIYEEVKHQKPAEDINKDPIVRIEFSNGILKQFGRSGKLLSEHTFNPEDYRLDEETLETLTSYLEKSISEDETVSSSIEVLDASGLQYNIKGKFYADVVEPSSINESSKISKYTYRVDLRTGVKIEEVAYDLQNRPLHYRVSNYVTIEGRHLLQRELFYEYGDLNNNWEVIGRKVTTRTNHKIIRQ